MHEIQKEILKKLANTKKARYSELKRKDLEGNIFSYHLKTLIKENYILSKDKNYILSAKGKHLADRVSSINFNERIQPKIVTMVILKNNNKYLLYKRKKQPFFGYIGFPYGKIHLDERISDAALRELNEKTGLKAKLKYRGHVHLTVHDEADLVSSMICYIFTGNQVSGELLKEFPSGECYWGNLEDVEKNKLQPGAMKIQKLLEQNTTDVFFEEYFLNTSEEV